MADLIIFDTETTGFVQPDRTPLEKQPQIIEYAAIKVDAETLEEKDRLEFLCNPGKKLPDEIVKITGITDKQLVDEKPFTAYYPELVKFHLGVPSFLAHNVAFDRDMLRIELQRMGKILNFPWPARHICTVEKSFPLLQRRQKLGELYYVASEGKKLDGAHRAMIDVEGLLVVVKWLRTKGLV